MLPLPAMWCRSINLLGTEIIILTFIQLHISLTLLFNIRVWPPYVNVCFPTRLNITIMILVNTFQYLHHSVTSGYNLLIWHMCCNFSVLLFIYLILLSGNLLLDAVLYGQLFLPTTYCPLLSQNVLAKRVYDIIIWTLLIIFIITI